MTLFFSNARKCPCFVRVIFQHIGVRIFETYLTHLIYCTYPLNLLMKFPLILQAIQHIFLKFLEQKKFSSFSSFSCVTSFLSGITSVRTGPPVFYRENCRLARTLSWYKFRTGARQNYGFLPGIFWCIAVIRDRGQVVIVYRYFVICQTSRDR